MLRAIIATLRALDGKWAGTNLSVCACGDWLPSQSVAAVSSHTEDDEVWGGVARFRTSGPQTRANKKNDTQQIGKLCYKYVCETKISTVDV